MKILLKKNKKATSVMKKYINNLNITEKEKETLLRLLLAVKLEGVSILRTRIMRLAHRFVNYNEELQKAYDESNEILSDSTKTKECIDKL